MKVGVISGRRDEPAFRLDNPAVQAFVARFVVGVEIDSLNPAQVAVGVEPR